MGTRKRKYLIDYEARNSGSQGKFWVSRVQVDAASARTAIVLAMGQLHKQDLEVRNPVRVHRKSGSDWRAIPYIPWREGGDDNPAGLREDLLDDEEQARATTSELELALLADRAKPRSRKGIGVGECPVHGDYYLDDPYSPCPSCEEADADPQVRAKQGGAS